MLHINQRIQIPDVEFQFTFVRSGGPGGQNVNKVATKAVLRWDVTASASLPSDVKSRLLAQQRGRLTLAGELVISSQRFRVQSRNMEDCLEKLRIVIQQAAVAPRKRKATRPTRSSREARLQAKRRRSSTKAARRLPAD
jgi:ribosome-associated protein